MPGEVKRLIDKIIEKRSNGNPTTLLTTKTKLLFKGINPDSFSLSSPDDPTMIQKVKQVATEMGIAL